MPLWTNVLYITSFERIHVRKIWFCMCPQAGCYVYFVWPHQDVCKAPVGTKQRHGILPAPYHFHPFPTCTFYLVPGNTQTLGVAAFPGPVWAWSCCSRAGRWPAWPMEDLRVLEVCSVAVGRPKGFNEARSATTIHLESFGCLRPTTSEWYRWCMVGVDRLNLTINIQ